MNMVSRWIALSALSLAVIPFVSGCGESESTEQVKETSTTTSYAQPAPAIVQAPPTTINTTEQKSSSHSTDMGNNSTAESTDAYHSESTTVTPAPIAVAPAPTMQSQTTEKKIYKESTD
jgi:hypothetical protein